MFASLAATYEAELDRLFKALADPTRRGLLRLLASRPHTVSEVVRHFSLAQPTISNHLAVLRQADLVHACRKGQFVFYQLNPEATPPALMELVGAAPPGTARRSMGGGLAGLR